MVKFIHESKKNNLKNQSKSICRFKLFFLNKMHENEFTTNSPSEITKEQVTHKKHKIY